MFQASSNQRLHFLRISLLEDLLESFMLQPRLNLLILKSEIVMQHFQKEKTSLLPEQVQYLITLQKMLFEMSLASGKAE